MQHTPYRFRIEQDRTSYRWNATCSLRRKISLARPVGASDPDHPNVFCRFKMRTAARQVSQRLVSQQPRASAAAGQTSSRLLSSTSTCSSHSSTGSQAVAPTRLSRDGPSSARRHLSKSSSQNASEVRPHPAPNFQQSPAYMAPPPTKSKEVLDASFVGMSGGKIFEEMMLRHGVKQIFGYPGESRLS